MNIRIKNLSADYLNRAVIFRKNIFDRAGGKGRECVWSNASLRDVRKAVVICAASRSGSSLLFSLLKKDPHFYSLSGESVPFYKLSGLSNDQCPSDEIPEEFTGTTGYLQDLSRDILSDLSVESKDDSVLEDDALMDMYTDDLALRFPLQWPQISFSYDTFKNLAAQASRNYKKAHKVFCKEWFYLDLLSALRGKYKAINPYYYDIPARMIKEKLPRISVPSAPPNRVLMIEEPPYILLSPRRKINKQDMLEKIFLMKSSVDCYRMGFIEKLMPHADIKVIHLTRNPAAAINGLYDGWRHRGFFSHNLTSILRARTLAIAGYSDRYAWGKYWWKFDLPPQWQAYAQRPLEEVCSFQWYAANQAIQAYLQKSGKKSCLIKHEHMIGTQGQRDIELSRIRRLAGINHNAVTWPDAPTWPVIQATHPPSPFRWKEKEQMILSLISTQNIRKMCETLGYDPLSHTEWL